MTPFVHLHNHTDCSFLDGAIKVKSLVNAAKNERMPAVAITDHGSLFGLIEFYREAVKAGIKPILGYEAYVAPDSRLNRSYAQSARKYDHLILLAENNQGYKNLMKLGTIAYSEGFYSRPRIDKEMLKQYSEGLICLSACIQGEIPRAIIQNDEEKAKRALHEYIDIFGKERFFLELQDHGIDEELVSNEGLIRLARSEGVGLVVTNDCHYIKESDHEAHEALMCIQTGKHLSDTKRMSISTNQLYFKSYEEMKKKFSEVPDALENTVKIAEMCHVNLSLDTDLHWPIAPKEEGFADDDEYLAHLSAEGVKDKFSGVSEQELTEVNEKIAFELEVMKKMRVAGYMIIVRDFIHAARMMNIPVGPGRGSCVGSLVSYVVGITDVNPLKHQLLFERFLNPERVSMPDIDIDFSDRDRNKVIQYVIQKYGKSCVCQIGTLGSMNAKAVIRDVARVMEIPLSEVNTVAKMIPDGPKVHLTKALEEVTELKSFFEQSETYKKWLRIALTLEGLKRQPGVHAAGVIIAHEDVVNYSPLYTQKDSDLLVTQYDKNNVESVGLLKMDFLGLRNLSVIQDAISEVERNHGVKVSFDRIELDDAKTYALFSKGETVGVFQFESSGMQEYLRKLKPNNIEDIIAMNALYRPGPMDNIPLYIQRKHGLEPTDYYNDDLKPYLKDTNGIIVYQEQVMQIAQVVGGFSLGRADILRRAMGKKKPEEMVKMREEFLTGAKAKNYKEDFANNIFDILAKFAEYGFNKSHAAAYSYVAYQTAYLKAHYPSEFMAANMTSELDNTDRVVILMNDCRRLGINVLQPDINSSFVNFRAEKEGVLFGLGAIKGVGVGAVEQIIAEREKNGPFKSIFDFCKRLDTRVVNKRVLEALIVAGAFDKLKGNRGQMLAAIETALQFGASFQRDREAGQTTLFGGGADSTLEIPDPPLPDADPIPYAELLKREKDTLGFYMTGHPLKDYEDEIKSFSTLSLDLEGIKKHSHEDKGVIGGIIVGIRRIVDKKGNPMVFVQLEGFHGRTEVVIFSKVYETCSHLIIEDSAVLVSGKLDKMNEANPKIIADRVISAKEAREKLTRSVHVRFSTLGLESAQLQSLKTACAAHTGPCSLVIHAQSQNGSDYAVRAGKIKVTYTSEFILRLRDLVGHENVWLGRDY
jgi:DNA polymerase-3 subunit alpha